MYRIDTKMSSLTSLGIGLHLIVRSVKEKIVANRVKASNLAHIFLRPYKTNAEGVPRDPSIPGAVERKSIINILVTGPQAH